MFYKRRKTKKMVSIIAVLSLILGSLGITPVYADTNLLYEKKDVQTIAQGLTYEKSRRMYKSGWLDMYVLTVDASQKDLALEVIGTVDKYGGKATVQKLANDNKVVAAVNGDFFGSGTLKSSMGQVAKDGDMIAAQNYYNGNDNKYAGLYIDKYGTPFIDYVKSSMGFYGPNNIKLEMGAKNKVTDFAKPVYFDRRVITSTKTIDAYFKKLTKIVVRDGAITYISNPGEIVDVPENGYIIVMSNATRTKEIGKFSVGMSVSFSESEKFTFRTNKIIEDIEMGISGGGEILRNGQPVANGLIIGQNVNNPRTMLGVNQDKSKIFIVCIDGRRNGKGATHAECAAILKEYGIYDAIHLDGGGSTTMAVQLKNSDSPTVVNVPSEGSLRAVANGVGIKVTGEAGVPARVEPYVGDSSENILFKDFESKIYVNVYDGQLNSMTADIGNLKFSSTLPGEWVGNVFTPTQTGKGTITVEYGDISGTVEVNVLKGAAALRVSAGNYTLSAGEKTALTAQVINRDGYSMNIDKADVSWDVDNKSVGHIEDGYFVADGDGTCVVTGKAYDVSAKMTIAVGKKNVAVNSFEAPRNFVMYYYPDDNSVEGKAESDTKTYFDGKSSVRIDYKFKPDMTTTQSVYAGLDNNPVALPKDASDISVYYKGDGSDNLLKAVINYGQGQSTDVVIAENLNSADWKKAEIKMPEGVTQPAYIERVYVSALNTTSENTQGSVYFDYVMAKAPASGGGGAVAENMKDYMEADLSTLTGSFTNISAYGTTKGITNADAQQLLKKMSPNASALVFAGASGITNTIGLPFVTSKNGYSTNENNSFSFVTLAVSKGSMRLANASQWRYLQDYLNRLSKKNVIILMDVYPWTGLTDSRERDALHDILKNASRNSDKNIVVLTSVGESTYVNIKDGIRYMNLCGNGGSDRRYVRFAGNDEELYYQFFS